jgi:PAS domain S-box-containing protein
MDKELRILMLEDSPADAELEEHELRKAGLVFTLKVVDTREAFLKSLDKFFPDIILSDYDLPAFDGLAALRIAKEKCPDVPFILVTGKVGEEFAIEKLKEGATDYVLKGNLKRLVPVIKRALEEAEQIANRKQAYKALRESEERFRQIAESAEEWIWEVDVNGLYTYSSPVVEKILGYKPEEIVRKKHFYDFFAPESREELKKAALGAFQSKQPFSKFINSNLHKNGTIVIIETGGTPILDEMGNLLGYRGADMDITERQRAEEEMLWKTVLLEAQINATIDGILIVDDKGNKVIQNQRCIDLWKIPRHIVDNRDDKQQVEFVMNRAKDPLKFVEKVIYLYSHPNETSREELEFKDGTILDRYSAPVIGKDGTYFGRIWIFRDVTEGKLAEKRIRESETIFQLLFDSMIEGVALHEIVYDDAGNAIDYLVIKVNPAYEKQTGISAKKAVGSLGKDIYGTSTPPYIDIFTHVAETGESYSFESYFPPIQKHFKIAVFSPKKGWFATVFEDITERKQTEEERDRILNMSYDLICIAGTDGYFKYVNPAWERTLGYSNEELLSKPFLDFIHPDDHQKNDEEVAKLSSGKQTYDFENRYIHKDGSIRIISWRATPLPEKGLMYCIGRDITESR